MDIHHATTQRYSTTNAAVIRRWRDSQTAQIANAAKTIAKPRRSSAHGKFE